AAAAADVIRTIGGARRPTLKLVTALDRLFDQNSSGTSGFDGLDGERLDDVAVLVERDRPRRAGIVPHPVEKIANIGTAGRRRAGRGDRRCDQTHDIVAL